MKLSRWSSPLRLNWIFCMCRKWSQLQVVFLTNQSEKKNDNKLARSPITDTHSWMRAVTLTHTPNIWRLRPLLKRMLAVSCCAVNSFFVAFFHTQTHSHPSVSFWETTDKNCSRMSNVEHRTSLNGYTKDDDTRSSRCVQTYISCSRVRHQQRQQTNLN